MLLLLVLVCPPDAKAAWQPDGVPVCAAAQDQYRTAIVSDGMGGSIVAWLDYRNGSNWRDVFAQRVDGAGTPQLAADGIALCALGSVSVSGDLAIVSDGAGGAIVAWQDRRNANGDIYAQRIDDAGDPVWVANGVAVCTDASTQYSPRIVSDGAGGCVIVWNDGRGGRYAQRVTGAGAFQWTANGVAIGGTGATTRMNAASDGAGGAIVTWDEFPSDANEVHVQRVDAAGVPQWTTGGVLLCAAASHQYHPQIVPDGAGGAIVAWSDSRASNNASLADIYAQRVNASGVAQWTITDGVPLCADPSLQSGVEMASDGAGGAVVTWYDLRNGSEYDLYAQRVSPAGNVQWMADGVPVCTAPGDQAYQQMVSDGVGEVIVTWTDARSGPAPDGYDVYAQRLDANGAAQWLPNGVALCSQAGDQGSSTITTDGAGGAIVAWEDRRNVDKDIYAQRVGSDGRPFSFTVTTAAEDYVTGTLWQAMVQANATPGQQTIRFDIPGAGPHVINANCLPFPAITDALTIDGFTQPGSSPNTNPVGSPSDAQIMIEISGPIYWWWGAVPGLQFLGGGTLRGVAISGFDTCVEAQSGRVVIEGCYIGTDASGMQVGPHQQKHGVHVLSNVCRIGGWSPDSRNVIANSYEDAIRIDGALYTEVYGNYIGVGADGTTILPNLVGVHLLNDASDARIGSISITTFLNGSEANVIHWNKYGGLVEGSASVRNFIAGNSMLGNEYTIDLGNDGSTPNDADDTDSGPNQFQNYPDLSTAVGDQISGTMIGTPNTSVLVHFYQSLGGITNAKRYVGGKIVEVHGSGSVPFSFTLPQAITPGGVINATASDFDGNTSEVSWPVAYQNTPPGPGAQVALVDANGVVRGTATFSNVTGAGNTVLTTPFTPPTPLTGGFYAGDPGDPSIYVDVTTDAGYTGGIEVCLFYDDSNLPGPESDLELVHYNGSNWEAVTSSRDELNNIICGTVTALSPFVIAVSTAAGIDEAPPNEFALHTNVPNPFNPVTTIRYDVPAGGADVSISIYDVAGRMVRELVDEHRSAGTWSVQWNGTDTRGQRVGSGVYFYRMRAGSFVETRKMVLLK
jgi:hypothetical protein